MLPTGLANLYLLFPVLTTDSLIAYKRWSQDWTRRQHLRLIPLHQAKLPSHLQIVKCIVQLLHLFSWHISGSILFLELSSKNSCFQWHSDVSWLLNTKTIYQNFVVTLGQENGRSGLAVHRLNKSLCSQVGERLSEGLGGLRRLTVITSLVLSLGVRQSARCFPCVSSLNFHDPTHF